MLNMAITFFVIAIIAALLGFGGVAGDAAHIGWIGSPRRGGAPSACSAGRSAAAVTRSGPDPRCRRPPDEAAIG